MVRVMGLAAIACVGSAWAATLCVSQANLSCYPTIAAAIADAGSGDVIDVSPGTYVGGAEIHVPNLHLRGPMSGVSGCQRIDTLGEAQLVFSTAQDVFVNADGVVVEG